MKTLHRGSFLFLACALMLGTLAPAARAQQFAWQSASDGNWSTPTSWHPTGEPPMPRVPPPDADAIFGINSFGDPNSIGTYAVTVSGNTIKNVTIGTAKITFSLAGSFTVTNTMGLGGLGADVTIAGTGTMSSGKIGLNGGKFIISQAGVTTGDFMTNNGGTLLVQNGGSLTSGANTVTSAGFSATVDGSNSKWTNTGLLNAGVLTITNGGMVKSDTVSSFSLTMTGGTLQSNDANFGVSKITQGSSITSTTALLSGIGADSTLDGSTWAVSGKFTGFNSSLVVKNGGQLTTGSVLTDFSAGIVVDGSGATWNNTNDATITSSGGPNAGLRTVRGGVATIGGNLFLQRGGSLFLNINDTGGASRVDVTGKFDASGSSGVFVGQNATLKSAGAVTSANDDSGQGFTGGVDLEVRSTWTNTGDFVVGESGQNTASGANTLKVFGGTLTTTGNLIVGKLAAQNSFNVSSNSTVTDVNGVLAQGAGSLTNAFVGNFGGANAKWTNSGTLTVADAGTANLSIDTGGTVTSTAATVGNQAGARGSVNISDGGNWTINGSFTVGSGGAGTVMIAGKDATCRVTGTVPGNTHKIGTAGGTGSVAISAGGVLGVAGNGLTLGDDVGGNGSISATGADSLLLVDTVFGMSVGRNGIGSVTVANGANIQVRPSGVSVAEESGSKGSISISDPGSFFGTSSISFGGVPLPGFQVKGGAGTITVQNSGQLRVDNTLRIVSSTANPSVIIDNGQIAVGSGAFGPPGSLRVSENGLLVGNERAVRGQVIIGIGGRISPGNSPGIFGIDGSYTQEAGGTFQAEIGGPDPGTGYDQITVTGAASLGGNLSVRLVNGFAPSVGQTFRIVSAGSVSGAFTSITQPSQAGINLTSDATGVTVTITSVVAGAPVISSPTTVAATRGAPFSYQIAATNNPTSFGATDLPAGLTVDHNTGLITGTPTAAGAFIVPINANNAAGSGQADLTIEVTAATGVTPGLVANVSTRLPVGQDPNALIQGFIVQGPAGSTKKILVRALGPFLQGFGITDFLANPTLDIFDGNQVKVASNDNWRTTQVGGLITGDQFAELNASGLAPTNDAESAIIANLAPGQYTAVVRGSGNSVGTGLVDAFDISAASPARLVNVGTRGLVQPGDGLLTAGFIVQNGSVRVVIRAVGPSLTAFGITNALPDTTLQLRDVNGAIVRENDDWMTDQKAELEATGLQPSNNLEAALIQTIPPGQYTAQVRGKPEGTGIGVVEVYFLQ